MDRSDKALVSGIVMAVLQAAKRLRIDPAFYAVVAVVVGIAAGAGIQYARTGSAGVGDGAIGGLEAAIEAAGAYGLIKAMSDYTPPAKQARDAQGRFAKKEQA